MTTSSTIRAGLIGAGSISPYHLMALRRLANVRVAGICDLDAARARARAREAGCPAFESPDELWAAGVDVVHVLTPPSTHAALAIRALEHGCHVLVEKPLATSGEDCDRIAAAAVRAGRTVGVNHSLLRDAFVERARQVARSGALGDIVAVDYFRSSEYPPYRGGPLPPQYCDGGYPFRDLGVHALYLLEAFLGEIRDVSASFSSRGGDPNLLYDEWRVVVRCALGSGQIHLSWNVRPLQHVLLVQGTRGVLRADLFGMNVVVKKSTPLPKSVERLLNAGLEGFQICTQTPANAVRFFRKRLLPYHGLQMMVADFYGAIAANRPPPVSAPQARPIVEWTERTARPADLAKERYRAGFPAALTARVLVTGATGFIGQHLLRRLLAENQRVRIFVRREPAAEWMTDPRVEVVLGDLGDPEAVDRAVAGTELIYHLGAALRGAPHEFERGTVAGTRHVVDSARKHRVAKLVYVSSLSVLHAAAARPDVPITEEWPLEPHPERRGSYSQSKVAAEEIVRAAVRQHGLNAVILRPGQVFGPGAPLLTPAVARRVKGRLVILGNGRVVLPLVYVDDVVEAIRLAGRRDDLGGAVFHLVDTARVTQDDLATRCATAGGPPARLLHVPRPLVWMLACGVELLAGILKRPAPLSRYRVRSALAPGTYDCAAAATRLNWRPIVGVESGLAKTLAAGTKERP